MYAIRSYYVARSIAMDELDSISNAEFYSTVFRLFGEQLAHIDAGADDAVIACPGAQHLVITSYSIHYTKLYDHRG